MNQLKLSHLHSYLFIAGRSTICEWQPTFWRHLWIKTVAISGQWTLSENEVYKIKIPKLFYSSKNHNLTSVTSQTMKRSYINVLIKQNKREDIREKMGSCILKLQYCKTNETFLLHIGLNKTFVPSWNPPCLSCLYHVLMFCMGDPDDAGYVWNVY